MATVLLMEDDELLARTVRRVLEREGHEVHHASTGRDARRVVERLGGGIDLLIADLVLPGLGGREAANLIVASNPEVKVLYTTGYVTAAPELEELSDFGFPVLHKPFDIPELLEAVEGAISPPAETPEGTSTDAVSD